MEIGQEDKFAGRYITILNVNVCVLS